MISPELQMFQVVLLSLAAGTPLLLATLYGTPFSRTATRLLPWATVPALIAALTIPVDMVVEVGWFFMGSHMGLDASGRTFLLLSAFLWLLASMSCRSLLSGEQNRLRFQVFFLVAMAGNFGLILARGMLGYYLFFAMMSFAAYGLVVHKGTDAAKKAGRLYLLLLMVGEVALFTALILMVHATGDLTFAKISEISYHPLTVTLLFIGFGVKIGAIPLHGWMIPAYQATPAPAAAVLAGAMVNAGILGWLRFLPLGRTDCPQGAALFITAGALAAIYGVIIGLQRKQPGAVLGASSISQMGLITVIFGLGLLDCEAGRNALPVLMLYVVHHSLAKSSLFFACDLAAGQDKGLSRLQMSIVLLPALALAGLPLTSGAIAKTAFKELALVIGEPWSGLSTIFLPLTAMATTVLVLHFISILKHTGNNKQPGIAERSAIFGACFLASTLALWLWPAATSVADHSLTAAKLLQALWPVAGGFLLFIIWKRTAARGKAASDEVKKQDGFDVLLLAISNLVQKKEWQQFSFHRLASLVHNLIPPLRKGEKVMGRWKVVGLSYLALSLCLLLLLL